jgi:aspartate/methionine/tyrosine aminotransferase
VDIEVFEMERMQSLYWHEVDYDLSESGVRPLTPAELLTAAQRDPSELLSVPLGYPLSEGSEESRAAIAAWYPGAAPTNVSLTNGGSEANHLSLWTVLGPRDRLAFMVPNYLQGIGLGNAYGAGVDAFTLVRDGERWALDLDSLDAAVGPSTAAVMVCNPNNPTGHVFTPAEMDAVIQAAERADAWLICDEIYRGAEVATDEASPTFWGRYPKTIVTSGLSKAFAMPGLRVGWVVAPEPLITDLWVRHDYTTLTPGMLSDRLAAVAMEPNTREWILERTRGIIRENLPPLEVWMRSHEAFAPTLPAAGAIAYAEYDLPISSTDLVDRIRRERSVLLVPGDTFGLGKGLRFGFGYDIDRTIEGLHLVDELLTQIA